MSLLRLPALAGRILLASAVVFGAVTAISTGDARAVEFSYEVDWFSVTHNPCLPPVECEFTLRDDFDGTSLSPMVGPWGGTHDWQVTLGTAAVEDGFLKLQSPGTPWPIKVGGVDFVMERSDVQLWYEQFFENAVDPVIVQSAWNFFVPNTNDWAGQILSFLSASPGEMHDLGIMLAYPNAATGAAFGFPELGIQIFQFWGSQLSEDPNEWEFTVESYPIIPAEVEGQIIFETKYYPSEGVYRQQFSLDGGATFLSPFSDLTGGPAEAIGLGADPVLIPEPTTALLLAIGLGGLAAAGRRRSHH